MEMLPTVGLAVARALAPLSSPSRESTGGVGWSVEDGSLVVAIVALCSLL